MDKVIYHNADLSSVFLIPDKKIPKFLSGQFLHLALDEYDPSSGFWPESRVFSIASAPFENYIRITYSVKGRFTRRMYNEIKENNYYWIKMPYGNFVIDDSEKVILIAGGTGITPFISFLKYRTINKIDSEIYLFYGVRSKSYFIFENELFEIKDKLLKMKAFFYCEDSEYNLRDDLHIRKGIINREDVLRVAQNSNSPIYISGPKVMIDYFVNYLVNNEIQRERIRLDEWE